MKTDFLFLTTSPSHRIEACVVIEMAQKISIAYPELTIRKIQLITFNDWLKCLSEILNAKKIVIHSPVVLLLPLILFARVTNKRTIAFIWDVYPVKINAKRYDSRLLRIILDFCEGIGLRLCNNIYVPSKDFQQSRFLKNSEVLNFWPQLNFVEKEHQEHKNPNRKLEIVFSGQVNETRGLSQAIKRLDKLTGGEYILSIASGNRLNSDLGDHPCVRSLGFLSKNDLLMTLQASDFGLISLNTGLDTPGFPSKIFSYVEAGLPSLYFGPELEEYVKILKKSNVGINLTEISEININTANSILQDFSSSQIKFQGLACNSKESIAKFVSRHSP